MNEAIELRAAAATSEIALDGAEPPKRIQLLRIGENPRRDGGKPYLVADRAHAEAIVAASNAYNKSTQPMIDYDHQSVFGAKDGVGGRAPAAGWMPKLIVTDDGIDADVEWTPAASAALAAREYRYISPYFGHRADGRVTRIFNAALTNRPELELRAVASQGDPTGESTLSKELATALGLPESATDADVLAAVNALVGDRAAICSALGLEAKATADEIRTAASAAGKVDPTKFAPIGELTALRQRLDAIEEERVTASVDAAIEAGKIAPASREWALGYAKKDAAGFAAFVGAQPEIVTEGAEQRRAAAIKEGKLTDEERAACSQLGISEEAFLASRKEMGL